MCLMHDLDEEFIAAARYVQAAPRVILCMLRPKFSPLEDKRFLDKIQYAVFSYQIIAAWQV